MFLWRDHGGSCDRGVGSLLKNCGTYFRNVVKIIKGVEPGSHVAPRNTKEIGIRVRTREEVKTAGHSGQGSHREAQRDTTHQRAGHTGRNPRNRGHRVEPCEVCSA